MSYILDALRKSDQQRQRGAVPMTLTVPAEAAKRPAVSLNGALALVLLAVGVAIGWLRPWQPVQRPAVPSAQNPPSVTRPAVSAPLQPEQTGKPVTELPTRKSASSAQTFRAPSVAAAEMQEAPALARAESSPPALSGVSKEAAPRPEQPIAADAAAATQASVMALNELPASIQQEIPSLSISLHGYASNPRDRITMINDKLLRQGDLLAPGLRLEQITADGVVFSYKGYRFHHGVR